MTHTKEKLQKKKREKKEKAKATAQAVTPRKSTRVIDNKVNKNKTMGAEE